MTDTQFEGYKKLLALAQANPTKLKLRQAMGVAGISFENEGEAWSGYYRKAKVAGGPLEPLAIWRDQDGDLYIMWGKDEARPEKVWPDCAWKPVPYEWYEAVAERGEEWPDIHTMTAEDDAEREPGIGDNNPPEATESSVLQGEIAEARAGLKKYAKIVGDEMAAAAQSLRSKLNELAGKADKLRDKLKRPHFEKAKAVDDEWQPLVKHAAAGADQIKAALQAWENEKLAKEQAAQAARDAEANAAAEAQEAAEWKARQEGTEAPASMPAQPEPPPAVAPQTTIKGGTGRAATISTVKEITEVTDWVALFNYFRQDKDVTDLLVLKANRVLKLNPLTQIPGVKIDDKRKVA